MMPVPTRLPAPALVLAADHRARGVMTIESYSDYLSALRAALPSCDGILATAQPLGELARSGALDPEQRTYLSINRTGLAGAAFELDDRLVATVDRAAADGWTGIKHMTRIAFDDEHGAAALELLGQVLEDAADAGLDAMIEPVCWRDGRMSRLTDDIVLAAVIAHDLGAPLLKVPVPDEPPGEARTDAVARVVAAVGVPVLFLGGPHRDDGSAGALTEARDAMAGGAAGLAIGRAVLLEPSPAVIAAELAGIVHGR
ncbi:MAG: Cgl0159 family (beta/alpha)8-fold protein [Acidimicrobiales bacterium]